jgi:hypothetical protein
VHTINLYCSKPFVLNNYQERYELVIIHRERVDIVQRYELVKIGYELVKMGYELVGNELQKVRVDLLKHLKQSQSVNEVTIIQQAAGGVRPSKRRKYILIKTRLAFQAQFSV